VSERLVVVTGGGSGIGYATGVVLMQEGWHVALVDRDASALAEAGSRHAGEPLSTHVLDVTDADAVSTFFAGLGQGPRLSALVNSAGIAESTDFLTTSAERFRAVLDVNVIGAFRMCQAAAAIMVEDGTDGAIVNITSGSGLRANGGRTAYGASKAALEMMSKVMAGELARHGIRVNTVAPGPIETPLVTKLHTPEFRKRTLAVVPHRRYGRPDEIGQAVAFLLDADRSGYISGHTLSVDGGAYAAGVFDAP